MYHPWLYQENPQADPSLTTCPRPFRSLKDEEVSHFSSLVSCLVAQKGANTFPCDFQGSLISLSPSPLSTPL